MEHVEYLIEELKRKGEFFKTIDEQDGEALIKVAKALSALTNNQKSWVDVSIRTTCETLEELED